MATPGVAVTLSGMSTPEQVDENVAIAERRSFMTDRQRRQMQQRLAAIKKKTMAFCTACGYCMPCPHGVDIPQNFTLYNQAHYLGLIELGRTRFKSLHKDPQGDKSALACKKCGKCLPKCPNKVPIIEQLVQTARLLG
jgi:predicted aldo/keto reductase-like oxidoreductase